VGGLLSVALLSVMGICLVLLANQLCDGGYGDVVLPSEWRIFGPLEGIVGLILFYLQ